jgi:hypothetical protein
MAETPATNDPVIVFPTPPKKIRTRRNGRLVDV